jgi:RNA polymerase sigma factor (sigma-70 family)
MTSSQDRSDVSDLIASQAHPAAFRRFYDRWAEPMLTYFYRRTWDGEVAADLTAETFAVAFEKRHRFRDLGRPAGAWLYGIAARELKRFRRRESTELRAVRRLGVVVPRLDDESLARIEELIDLAPLRREISRALAGLSDPDGAALQLRVIDGEPYAAVAASLGCSEGAARVRVHRALARLGSVVEGGSP